MLDWQAVGWWLSVTIGVVLGAVLAALTALFFYGQIAAVDGMDACQYTWTCPPPQRAYQQRERPL